MSASPETHRLLGDIAYSLMKESEDRFRKSGHRADKLAAGWLHCAGFDQYIMSFDGMEEEMSESIQEVEQLVNRQLLRRGIVTQV